MKQEGKQFQYTEDGHLILLTPEERKLLITDLTARIEYGVICMIDRVDDFGPRFRDEKLTGFCIEEDGCFYFDFGYGLTIPFAEKVKPYLRPMTSMNKEEMEHYHILMDSMADTGISFLMDWLNKNHFDYRGLIPMGLALEAPEGMYEDVSQNT